MGNVGPQALSHMTAGENIAIETVDTVASVSCPGGTIAIDGQALLVDASRRVRSDADFVFYNAPKHHSGAVEIRVDSGLSSEVSVDLGAIESDIDRVVLTVSTDARVGDSLADFHTVISQRGRTVANFTARWPAQVTALMVGEFYRRAEGWKFRAIGQGWDTGLAGLATEFGVNVDDNPTPAQSPPPAPSVSAPRPHEATRESAQTTPPGPPLPPSSMQSDWYRDPQHAGILRWFDSSGWSTHTRPIYADPAVCDRCGQPLRMRRFRGSPEPCRACEHQISRFMTEWRSNAWQALVAEPGTKDREWDRLWTSLRFERIPTSIGKEAVAALGMSQLEQIVAFAFADGEIEEDELEKFDRTVRDLRLHPSTQLSELQQRMQRGRIMTQVRAGNLPRVTLHDVHLDPDELAYLDILVTRIRRLASGPKYDQGRLIVSNKKIRFTGASGVELNWTRVVSVQTEYRNVVISATTAQGGATFAVHNPEYTGAVIEGALRIAKRQVLTSGQRDTRAVPKHVRNEVWQRDHGQCTECGARHYLEFDHVIPLSLGGATSVANLQLLCRGCNLVKGARL